MTLTFSSPMPDAAAAFAAIELIQAIHHKGGDGFCNGCDYGWPCATIEAINAARGGEQAAALSGDHIAVDTASLRRQHRDELWREMEEALTRLKGEAEGRLAILHCCKNDGDSDDTLPDFAVMFYADYLAARGGEQA